MRAEFDEPEQITINSVTDLIKKRQCPVLVYCTDEQEAKLEHDLEDHS